MRGFETISRKSWDAYGSDAERAGGTGTRIGGARGADGGWAAGRGGASARDAGNIDSGGSGWAAGSGGASARDAGNIGSRGGNRGNGGSNGNVSKGSGARGGGNAGGAYRASAPGASGPRANSARANSAEPDGGEGAEPSRGAPYRYPELSLLYEDQANKNNYGRIRAQTQETAMLLEEALQSFKVKAKVVGISRGPSVTRYEMQPDTGVKVNAVMNLAEDISLKLAASGIRIAPIANLSAIGIEVPNKDVSTVYLKEIIDSETFRASKSPLTFAIGKDISGNTITADIAKMPHMLVAGSTGSGKSVCINCIIVSLLYKSSPDDVKLILIDPKVVELGIYNDIPHLLHPVVTDPKKAAGALNWAVQEMLSRYKAFSEKKVKDLAGYNNHVARDRDGDKMPRIVIIIDELADLMMASPKEVEDSICRLTQMARAAGMHIVIATQRPSVDVITGLIKANIPSRVAFAVSSQVDSRTILDTAGAEKLLGKGDMLFHPVGEKKPVRIQGAFISEGEVERIVDYIKAEREAVYDEDIIEGIEKAAVKQDSGKQAAGGGSDELLQSAAEFVVDQKQASTSSIQRKFSVGYARAARIIDQMEERGIISGFDGSKPRRALISRQQFQEMKW
jgi:S-DNA-T family DNA segregation ATPase FtsK/SpoIIIE